MYRNQISRRMFSPLALAAPLALTALVATGCGEKPFAKVNGQVITRDDYLRKIERQQIPIGQNTSVTAERLVIDQLVGDKIILSEAARLSVMPTDDDVNKMYRVEQQLYENANPGKKYEEDLQKQGTMPDEHKADLKVQAAETAVYAKLLNLGEDEVRKTYNEQRDRIGLPARTQLRLILLPANVPQLAEVQKQLADPKKFDEAAKTLNVLPQLKATNGLQVMANTQIPPTLQGKIQQTAEGAFFGPVDWPIAAGQSVKAWVKVEKKLPAFTLPLEDAAPLIRRSIVQQRILLPENAKLRDQIMGQKLNAKFEATDAMYGTVWDAVKQQAIDAGVGKLSTSAVPATGTMPAGSPAPAASPK